MTWHLGMYYDSQRRHCEIPCWQMQNWNARMIYFWYMTGFIFRRVKSLASGPLLLRRVKGRRRFLPDAVKELSTVYMRTEPSSQAWWLDKSSSSHILLPQRFLSQGHFKQSTWTETLRALSYCCACVQWKTVHNWQVSQQKCNLQLGQLQTVYPGYRYILYYICNIIYIRRSCRSWPCGF